MKSLPARIVFLFFVLAAGSFAFNVSAQRESDIKLDCFSVLVGKNVSADGSVIFAHNEDVGLKLVNYYKVPGAKHKPGVEITLQNGGKVPQVKATLGYLWINIPGINVSDSYMNEFGVAIASDGCSSRENNPELKDGGIVYWLRRIVAERARSAKEGVKIAGKFIDEYGYASSGRTYIIADPNEGWMLSVVHGKHWVAQRVPDDMVAVIPNYYTIGEIDLFDTINFLGSPDIIEYAIEQGWYDPAQDGDFHFARAYANPSSLNHPGNINRMWRGVNLVSGKNFNLKDEFRFAVEPQEKVSIQEIMSVLRDHYEGTPLDKSLHYTLGSPYEMNRATICSPNTQYGLVAQLRNWLPVEIGAVMWIAPYRPDVQAFSPWYSGLETIPEVYAYGDFRSALKQQFYPPDKTFDRTNEHAFWTFVSLVEKVDENYGGFVPQIQKKWKIDEVDAFEVQDRIETRILKIYRQNPDKASELITDYSNRRAIKIYKKANKMTK